MTPVPTGKALDTDKTRKSLEGALDKRRLFGYNIDEKDTR